MNKSILKSYYNFKIKPLDKKFTFSLQFLDNSLFRSIDRMLVVLEKQQGKALLLIFLFYM